MKRVSKNKPELPKGNAAGDVARLNESFVGAVIVTKSGKPPSAPVLPAPGWARYVDSRLKQFCSR